MRDHKAEGVARALLFDRLIDLDPLTPREPRPFRTLNRAELFASVQRELERLLNTRCSYTLEQLSEKERSVIDYGASDLAWVSPLDPDHQLLISHVLTRTISAFEPRLRHVRVTVSHYDPQQGALYVTVDATLVTERTTEPVSFPVNVQTSLRDPEKNER